MLLIIFIRAKIAIIINCSNSPAFYYLCRAAGCSIVPSFDFAQADLQVNLSISKAGKESPGNTEHHTS